MQAKWRLHFRLQEERKEVLRHFWEMEMDNAVINKKQKRTVEWLDEKKYIEKLGRISDEVKEAILRKWLHYATLENLSDQV